MLSMGMFMIDIKVHSQRWLLATLATLDVYSLLPSMSTRKYKLGLKSVPVYFELARRKAVKMGCNITSGHLVPSPKYIGVHVSVMPVEQLLRQRSIPFNVDNPIVC